MKLYDGPRRLETWTDGPLFVLDLQWRDDTGRGWVSEETWRLSDAEVLRLMEAMREHLKWKS